ncbi:PepSY domain-containing protein [Algibacter pectinivorans]|uniref:Sulfite reductase (NADPH) flavoprotein alpha-component n=1 Tax=Algibacter pectinivorans TaxID=870482 RepID=A0A1I1QQZ9_9FLAO|nr:PepSY domain-containing protein [Algibacter pectinivorans]SFD24546.1 sulfite reductase (NADPH) flavoprotein alpha-component [Algibacter pectinivorans]
MTISIWRLSHLILAISSSLFIILAALTGTILAFEPISNKLEPFAVKNASALSLSSTIENLKNEYDEIINIEIDKNNFITASVVTKQGQSDSFYLNPFTAKKIGNTIEKAPIFRFTTNLHRSLFLKSTGRAIVGIVSFVLFLMAITGIILIAKRQGSLKDFFSKTIKEDFNQYYHVLLGKYTLIPIIIVTLTGVFLSLERFSFLPESKTPHIKQQQTSISTPNTESFNIFNTLTLGDIKGVEFPFSDDIEDYFIIKLHDKELYVNQYNGQIVSEKLDNFKALATHWSLVLHTGQGSILWSILLLLTSISILFFVYSGFSMALTRKNNTIKIKNTFNKNSAEYIILVGSETGSTFKFAKLLFNALLALGKSVYISELNQYTTYKKATNLLVLTSTYGEGNAPDNAKYFEKLIQDTPQENTLQYAVVGFGSLAYKGFCKYAILVDGLLQQHKKCTPSLTLHKINNKSFTEFKNWADTWAKSKNLALQVNQPKNEPKQKITPFKVVTRINLNSDYSFLLEIQPLKKIAFKSGDLLSITPKNETVARQYSIGKTGKTILLSIKKHEFGVCSNYLNNLKLNDMLSANIEQNTAFHFPKSAKEVIMISNGTGIAPFLGMITDENLKHSKNYLFWGGRTNASYKMYSKYIDDAFYNKKLSGVYLSFSQGESQKKYVQNALMEKEDLVSKVLKNNGIVMICGSVAMQNGVLKTLEHISRDKLNTPLNMKLIKTDCY